jgi:hypothetical protein
VNFEGASSSAATRFLAAKQNKGSAGARRLELAGRRAAREHYPVLASASGSAK